jgi:hypothetical protein
MTFVWVSLFVLALVVFWVLWGRNAMKRQPWAAGFFNAVEPIERWLWDKSETILWSRFLIVVGLLPPILDQLKILGDGGLLEVIPEQYRPWLSLTITLCGIVSEVLRRSTTKPLEIVSLPENKPPAVAEAVERAEATKLEAVAAVKEARVIEKRSE